MTTSSVYHLLGLRHQKLLRTDYLASAVVFKVSTKQDKLRCSACKSFKVKKSGKIPRVFKSFPIGSRTCSIKIDVQRLECEECGKIRQEHLSFAKPKKHYTRSMERYVLDLLQLGTIKDISMHTGLLWDTVKDIEKEHLNKKYKRIDLSQVKRIGIDEFAIAKGHKYMTIVVDLDTGQIIYSAQGKDEACLNMFWKKLNHAGTVIETVTMDMSIAFISAAITHIPEATLVFDKFQVIKNYNDMLSKLRRMIFNQEKNDKHKKILKGTRWLLLKNKENLREDKDEYQKLKEALDLNESLAIAYYLKDELKLLWKQKSLESAKKILRQWVAKAYASKIPLLHKFANSLLAHKTGLLNWYKDNVTNAMVEGINNKIKTMKRQAYGYRDKEFFKLKLYDLHKKTTH